MTPGGPEAKPQTLERGHLPASPGTHSPAPWGAHSLGALVGALKLGGPAMQGRGGRAMNTEHEGY